MEIHKLCRKESIRLYLLTLFFTLYVLMGGVLFEAVETPYENNIVNEMRKILKHFKSNNSCVGEKELLKFLKYVIEANNRGVSMVDQVMYNTSTPNWSFGQSVFFAGTVLTTIGYGRVTPLSEGGKAFCLIFAVIGIPITLVFLGAVAERLAVLSNSLLTFLCRKLLQPIEYKEIGQNKYRMPSLTIFHVRMIHLFLVVTFIGIVIFIIPASIYSYLEPTWSFFDSFYYCFISMTTIGLGDYIPGDSPNQQLRPLYKLITTVYLFIGLTFMILLVQVVSSIPEFNMKYKFSVHRNGNDEDSPLSSSDKSTVTTPDETTNLVNKKSPQNNNMTFSNHKDSIPSTLNQKKKSPVLSDQEDADKSIELFGSKENLVSRN